MAEKKAAPVTERRSNVSAEEKAKALETALSQIEKQFGKGAVMKLGQDSTLNVEAISTGSLSLDIALGIGGVPKGRIIEIYGPESSGKTTVALHVAAQAQKAGGAAVFIDVEHALDPVYAQALGVDIDSLLVSQPDTGEQALEIAEALVRSGAVDVVVVDSVAAMVTKAEIEGEMGDSHVGVQARLMSQALRKLTGAIGKSNCIVIFINQLREKIGVMYGNPETTPGGRALKFYASVRLDVRRTETLKSGTEMIGSRTRVKVVKNKVSPPFKEAEFDIMYGTGISKEGEILDLGAKLEIVDKSGSWFNYGDVRLGQGRDNAKEFLKANPEVAAEIEAQVRANADKLLKSNRTAGKKPVKVGAKVATEEPVEADASAEPAKSSAKKVNIDVETD
ncbi:recombinase RecA [Anaerotruncus sp. 1XD42-93]|uniref:recombinase RecA n=1 Tax=Anaerotruncus sp. 1XD42-93 TaxID=2320853 RepID=UPI000EA1E942|nr:recombinase RecA [Anaerotruncus sp. 1XD42-93]NBK17243.1 recombinase RecA [Anaerotruncus sp. 1XD42-93]NCE73771.1 recombinase RecA [Anaerotruncus sp. X29]RKJ97909.1 recombinase RecA [Anaerotruncus sp. 1XD22-93]